MLLQETASRLSLVFLIGDRLVNALVTINSRIVGLTWGVCPSLKS